MLIRQGRAGTAQFFFVRIGLHVDEGWDTFSREVTDLVHGTCRALHIRGSLVVVVRGMKELR